tara:strand:+ start:334 stop:2049 length:1716 start_codon:yes stop_codon:yes gene_type:complete
MSLSLVAGDYSQEVLLKRNSAIVSYVDANAKWDWEKIEAEGGLFGPNNEFKDAVDFLYKQNPETRPFIKFFTAYTVPHSLREQEVYTLSFELHSLAAWSNQVQPTYRPLAQEVAGRMVARQQVPGSATLWWIDIRDFGWTNQAFEKVVKNDPYFVPPIVDERISFVLNAEGLSTNILLRVDWANTNFMDAQRQIDRGLTPIYETLIYSRLARAPRNKSEWDDRWKQRNANEFYTLVTKSRAVGRYNRVLETSQGRFGSHYETFDVVFQEGARDYVEDLFNFNNNKPRISDAGEMIAENQLGMLVYAIRDNRNNLVSFGDPTAVRHPADIVNDVRVRTAHSCVDCHAGGPLKAENTLNELLAKGVKIRFPRFDDKADLEAAYLSDGFNRAVLSGETRYASAMQRVNGLTPEQNGANYLTSVAWYNQPVTLEQAAIEIGVTKELLQQRLIGKVGGRLALLVSNGEPIPRDSWDSIGRNGVPGGYQQAMVLVYGLVTKEVRFQTNLQRGGRFAVITHSCGGFRSGQRSTETPFRTLRAGNWRVFSEEGTWVGIETKDGTKLFTPRSNISSFFDR